MEHASAQPQAFRVPQAIDQEKPKLTPFEQAQLLVQSIGIIVVALTLYVYYRQLRTMGKQHEATAREMSVRMRPWIGLFDFGFEPAQSSALSGDTVTLLLRNFGALPAQRVQLRLLVQPRKPEEGEPDNVIHWQETGVKALVPQEDGDYRIDLSKYPQFTTWREARRDVSVDGNLQYELGERRFHTEFEATLRFSEGPKEDDHAVKTRWRNREVV